MGLDASTEAVLDEIPFDRARARLRKWASDYGIRMALAGWTGSGYTTARLLGAYVYESRKKPHSVIIKVNPRGDPSREDGAHYRALRSLRDGVADRLADRLADQLFTPLQIDGGGGITFQGVAQGGFGEFVGFRRMLDEYVHPQEACRAVVRWLLTGWNEESGLSAGASVAEFLREMLGTRIHQSGTLRKWAGRHTGLLDQPRRWLHHPDGDLVNPFALALDDTFGAGVDLLPLRGHVHGDLHSGNLLLAKAEKTPPRFTLVDLARYSENGPLAWDSCYLMVTTAAEHLKDLGNAERAELRTALLDRRMTDPESLSSRLPRALRWVIAGIHQGEQDFARDRADQWERQRLLCLVATGLILSGRSIIPAADRAWWFWFAAHAATAILPGATPDDPLIPPDHLIEPEAAASAAYRAPSSPGSAPCRPSWDSPMVNHEEPLRDLRRRLASGPWGVVVVTGPRGVGKSRLVDAALSGFANASDRRAYWHEAVAGTAFDVKTLLDDVEGASAPGTRLRTGESALARLEAALEEVGDTPVVIVVDHAERLLRPGAAELADSELDEAFETLAIRSGHRVAVVLISSIVPASPHEGVWPSIDPPVSLGRLRYEDFVTFLRDHDDHAPSLGRLDDEALARLHWSLQGNPRLAELFHSTLVLTTREGVGAWTARTLADELVGFQPREVPAHLAGLLIDTMHEMPRRVLDVLAAYGTPVDVNDVMALLDDVPSEDVVDNALQLLVESLLVRELGDGRYEIASPDTDWILDRIPATGPPGRLGRSRLLHRAANVLYERHGAEIRGIDDLGVRLAELRALIRAGLFGSAYDAVETIHDAVQEWNGGFLLTKWREELRGRLGDEFLEMANDNALAGLHTARGRLDTASDAYGRALASANDLDDERSRMKIRANLGALYWECNDAGQAYNYYDLAHDDAVRLTDRTVEMGTLEGLADCHRRWGRYPTAVSSANAAMAVPLLQDFPATDYGQRAASRRVRLLLKLARWHAESGLARAAEYVDMADSEAGADKWLQAACLDARADLLLGTDLLRGGDQPAEATKSANDAIALAFRLHDPVILLQAQTTLSVAHLTEGRRAEAAAEIERIERYRRPGRSLLVLALLALTARQKRRFPLARKRFGQLLDEAQQRFDNDRQDFGALQFHGYAICGGVLDAQAGSDIADAVDAFRIAHSLAPQATGLIARLRFLLVELDACGRRPGRLQPAIDALSATAATPGEVG